MRTMRLIAAVLAVAGLAGCKMNLTADLYSSDLRAAKAGTPGLVTPATLAFQVPSVKECDEYTAKIGEIMAGILDDFTPKGCQRQDMESFLLADTQMPIFASEDDWEKSEALFGILLYDPRNQDRFGVAVVLNTKKYSILTNRMKEKFHQTVDLSESKVSLILNNDERDAITFTVLTAFVNSSPVFGAKQFKLNRRQKADIVLSDVATAFLEKKGVVAGLTVDKSNKSN